MQDTPLLLLTKAFKKSFNSDIGLNRSYSPSYTILKENTIKVLCQRPMLKILVAPLQILGWALYALSTIFQLCYLEQLLPFCYSRHHIRQYL